ncbi:ATP-dependent sacrificial sulfur transferase LarE [Phytohabitans sp. ZYX-F-186]|uniref:ATP-dependent sacrificial sulfur transferase LarE n=1 Tax=Phytohabitans maris TaxID=3071409 RepID=A0ABU0ZVF9_9ACTN|nr:ATP-dependent sacrificial sulfur transferase LarE [Phytohabitans sp. ZYX-F-186]MDQ7911024.1 ATP-dependent sacrificial sulfur transferase LarE [Phytohabitans sp. ZYX-F-186]
MLPPYTADRLVTEIAGYGRTLVAFSGGVDSSVVLAAAARALGPGGVAAVTAVSPAVPAAEVAEAAEFCARLGVAHHAVETRELDVAGYRENGPRRCYFCKSTLLDTARRVAAEHGFDAVATGTNASDVAAGFRPGIRAAAERGARTPLADLGLDKAAVRAIARVWDLRTADKPAAACLSSRIAYGVSITPARLARVERAEAAARRLLAAHHVHNVRVRDLGATARLEVDAHVVDAARDDAALHAAIRAAGFDGAEVAVEPFRSGSMNEMLADPERWRSA